MPFIKTNDSSTRRGRTQQQQQVVASYSLDLVGQWSYAYSKEDKGSKTKKIPPILTSCTQSNQHQVLEIDRDQLNAIVRYLEQEQQERDRDERIKIQQQQQQSDTANGGSSKKTFRRVVGAMSGSDKDKWKVDGLIDLLILPKVIEFRKEVKGWSNQADSSCGDRVGKLIEPILFKQIVLFATIHNRPDLFLLGINPIQCLKHQEEGTETNITHQYKVFKFEKGRQSTKTTTTTTTNLHTMLTRLIKVGLACKDTISLKQVYAEMIEQRGVGGSSINNNRSKLSPLQRWITTLQVEVRDRERSRSPLRRVKNRFQSLARTMDSAPPTTIVNPSVPSLTLRTGKSGCFGANFDYEEVGSIERNGSTEMTELDRAVKALSFLEESIESVSVFGEEDAESQSSRNSNEELIDDSKTDESVVIENQNIKSADVKRRLFSQSRRRSRLQTEEKIDTQLEVKDVDSGARTESSSAVDDNNNHTKDDIESSSSSLHPTVEAKLSCNSNSGAKSTFLDSSPFQHTIIPVESFDPKTEFLVVDEGPIFIHTKQPISHLLSQNVRDDDKK